MKTMENRLAIEKSERRMCKLEPESKRNGICYFHINRMLINYFARIYFNKHVVRFGKENAHRGQTIPSRFNSKRISPSAKDNQRLFRNQG